MKTIEQLESTLKQKEDRIRELEDGLRFMANLANLVNQGPTRYSRLDQICKKAESLLSAAPQKESNATCCQNPKIKMKDCKLDCDDYPKEDRGFADRPVSAAPVDPKEPDGWISVNPNSIRLMPDSEVDIKLKNGSIIIGVTPQLDGDYWTRDVTGAELFIDESMVTHYRLPLSTSRQLTA